MSIGTSIRKAARRVQRGYAGDADRPLGGYVAVMGVYGAIAGGMVLLGRATGVRLPTRWTLGETVLLGTATFKASRLLSKDAVTSPLRAPFTRFATARSTSRCAAKACGTRWGRW